MTSQVKILRLKTTSYSRALRNIFFCFQDYENYASENMNLNHTITIMKQEFNNIRNQKQFKH